MHAVLANESMIDLLYAFIGSLLWYIIFCLNEVRFVQVLINIKFRREEFDEEKEPDGMILSGWTEALVVEKNGKTSADNGASTSGIPQATPIVTEDFDDDDLQILPTQTGKKRKLSDIAASSDVSPISKETKIKRKAEEIDGSNDVVMLDDGSSENSKKTEEP